MPAKNGSCVLIGEESLLVECGYQLIDRGLTIAAVISQNKQIADWAASIEAKLVTPSSNLEAHLTDFDYDWFFSIANLRMLPEAVWRKAKRSAINFHDGPLPRYAGLNTPAWALLAGESTHGVTWHALTDGPDRGDIYVQRLFDISADETTLTLNTKCFEAGIASFTELLDKIESGPLLGLPQNFDERSYFARDKKPEAGATIDFSQTSTEILRLFRALDFGANYDNPLCLPKIKTAAGVYNINHAEAISHNTEAPGTVVAVNGVSIDLAVADGVLRLSGISDANGEAVQPQTSFTAGEKLPEMSREERVHLTELLENIARHERFFRKKIAEFRDIELYGLKPVDHTATAKIRIAELTLPQGMSGQRGISALLAVLSRLSDQSRFDVAFLNDQLADHNRNLPGYLGTILPLGADLTDDTRFARFEAQIAQSLAQLGAKTGFAGDLISRSPELKAPAASCAIRLTDTPEQADAIKGAAFTFILSSHEAPVKVCFDETRIDSQDAETLISTMQIALNALAGDHECKIADLRLISPEMEADLIHKRNQTERNYDRKALIHQLIEAQARKTPDAIALDCSGRTLTYAELDAQANIVAQLLQSRGIGADDLVGIYMHRSVDLVVAGLGILKAGAAYVPLDPTYPADRIALMIEDSQLRIILAQKSSVSTIPANGPDILTIEDIAQASSSTDPVAITTQPDNLAYVIYTSGSTGRPKGVMVEHRNVVNFFAAMDDRITVPDGKQPVWLAVTSLSFDISVLELFWTLTRGFKVVIHANGKTETDLASRRRPRLSNGNLDFSLFYWGHDDKASRNKYHLLLESARYADERGFCAIWTPERHFHAFGGSYPNPSVTGAAVASITKNLEVRAGSCVLPLHHPARVAEEWAVIDNITNGRTGLAVASGWMPDDFLLRPENAPPNNKAAMLRDIETLRQLWRGEKVAFDTAGGRQVEIVTQPRPVQSELPIWVTTAGNPETYRDAARSGAHVLTHLLGQSISELSDKVRIYREALKEAGRDPSEYKVTLMLHTLVGYDRDEVRELARQPMKDYLRSAAGLIKQYAWAFPAFKKPQGVSQPMDIDLQTLEEDELDAILEFAFLRYFDDSGFFGTIDDVAARAEELQAIGVDEIACLIDFGVSHELVLKSLKPLAEAVSRISPQTSDITVQISDEDTSIAALIARHGVTHIQCTPSMATMLLVDEDDKRALNAVQHLYIGGEALSPSLIRDLRSATDATIENMYGPTETTIWSSTATIGTSDTHAPLGTAIANTQLYILDERMRPVPPGLPGELMIGGDGVTRGYFKREELTDERFLPNPFIDGERIYRTGDLVRLAANGELQFIGRTDHQVKVRGYRIELGEIEAQLALHPDITEAVVITREDKAEDVRLVAYVKYKSAPADSKLLVDHLRKDLPSFMIPAHFVTMDAFPLTPNAKIDRKALPRPNEVKQVVKPVEFIVPGNDIQRHIADSFKRVLGVERVGAQDNFFQLGGHSLLAVQLHRDLKKNVAPQLTITDIYRFPTVAELAGHVQGSDEADEQLSKIASRAAMRRNAMGARRNLATRDG